MADVSGSAPNLMHLLHFHQYWCYVILGLVMEMKFADIEGLNERFGASACGEVSVRINNVDISFWCVRESVVII